MNFPVFIFYELLIRLSALEPETGEYVANALQGEHCILRTTKGTITIPIEVLERQFSNPDLITENELKLLKESLKEDYSI